VKVISYGGGVQSTALLVLAAQGDVSVDAVLFANVGDDSEHPATLDYVRDVADPYGERMGVPVVTLSRPDTVLQRILGSKVGSTPIPMRAESGAPGVRSCTIDYKIKVISKWTKEHGATADDPASVLIGFSWDEAHRVKDMERSPWEVAEYPLLDRRLTRHDCQNIIERAGLPVPHKSSCFFCPFHRPSVWAQMRRDEPALFIKSAEIETEVNRRRTEHGKPPMFLTRLGKPLELAINAELQDDLDLGGDEAEGCHSGDCHT
jgi:hypothetical protein